MSDATQQLETLTRQVASVNTRIAKADALKQMTARNLQALKLEAELEFGTSDPAKLEEMAEAARKEAEAQITKVSGQLAEAERLLAVAEKALQA